MLAYRLCACVTVWGSSFVVASAPVYLWIKCLREWVMVMTKIKMNLSFLHQQRNILTKQGFFNVIFPAGQFLKGLLFRWRPIVCRLLPKSSCHTFPFPAFCRFKRVSPFKYGTSTTTVIINNFRKYGLQR